MFIAKVSSKIGNLILKSLKEIHSNESGNVVDERLLETEEINLESDKEIYEIFKTKLRTIFLGEQHSMTYSTGKVFLDYCKNEKKKSCLIIFDAHADCLNSSEPNSRSWLRKLIEAGFPLENVLIVGARNIHQEENKFLKENRIIGISMNSLIENLPDICDTIMEFANGKELYVSIDIDVIDPVFAPSTSYPEIGGLTSRQFIYLIQRIKKIKTLKAIDLTEINEDDLTIKLGAKILAELL
jgi:agmatinase